MLARRQALAMGATAVIAWPIRSWAIEQCPAPDQPQGTCSVMLDPKRFAMLAVPAAQKMNEWCWAACIEMICRWHGYPLSQESVVKRIYGGVVNMPGGDQVLTTALNSTWQADDGRKFRIAASVYSAALGMQAVNNQQIVDDLKNGMPLLNGSRSHATVTARVDYMPNPSGQPLVQRVHVIDPWPDATHNPERARFLEADEMLPVQLGGSLRFIASIRIAAA